MNSLTTCSHQGVLVQEKGGKECVVKDISYSPHSNK